MNDGIVISIIFFILSLIPAYYFYVKSLRNKEPVYSIKSNNLISGSVSTLNNLLISYKNQKIENLTVSKILFYNRGSETINQQDTQTINPLRISSETCRILDASLVQANQLSNNFKIDLNEENEHITIGFDYLDKNQGAVIQVIHTGLSSDYLNIKGDIKGVQKLVGVPSDKLVKTIPLHANDKILLRIAVLFAIVFISAYSFEGSYLNSMLSSDNVFVQAMFLFGALSTFILALVILVNILAFIQGLFVPSIEIPEGLEKFTE